MGDGETKPAAGESAPGAGAQTPPRQRPNARYQLSGKQTGGDEPAFYYSRERRLAKAPQAVRDLYKEEPSLRFNLLRPLIGSRPRAMMFGCIVLICATMLILSIFGYTGGSYALAGNSLSVQARHYDGALVVTLKKTVKKGGLFPTDAPYTGAVDIAVSPAARDAGETPPVFYHRVFFSIETAEEYRFSVPFDSDKLVMVLQSETKSLSLKLRPERQ